MGKLTINANLFRAAYMCVSSEATYGYLNGVYVEPHVSRKGITLTATDGHRLVHIYDESGYAEHSAIIKLSKEALKACKPVKNDTRIVSIEDDEALILIDGKVSVISHDCLIDGPFPDYRRVLPSNSSLENGSSVAGYNPDYLTGFGEIGRIISESKQGSFTICNGSASPALIRFNGTASEIAFGVLMPVVGYHKEPLKLPAWFNYSLGEDASKALQAAE